MLMTPQMLVFLGHLLSQQHLSGCHPLPTAEVVLPVTIFFGFLCIALGCLLQAANSSGNRSYHPYFSNSLFSHMAEKSRIIVS